MSGWPGQPVATTPHGSKGLRPASGPASAAPRRDPPCIHSQRHRFSPAGFEKKKEEKKKTRAHRQRVELSQNLEAALSCDLCQRSCFSYTLAAFHVKHKHTEDCPDVLSSHLFSIYCPTLGQICSFFPFPPSHKHIRAFFFLPLPPTPPLHPTLRMCPAHHLSSLPSLDFCTPLTIQIASLTDPAAQPSVPPSPAEASHERAEAVKP